MNDNTTKCTGLFMDLSKAVDCVNHDILMRKLERMGIRGLALNLFGSYLCNRQLIVNVNEMKSKSTTINIGVPQGSVIGPILYLLYVNDIGKLKLHGRLRLYADDSSVFYASRSFAINIQMLKKDLAKSNTLESTS